MRWEQMRKAKKPFNVNFHIIMNDIEHANLHLTAIIYVPKPPPPLTAPLLCTKSAKTVHIA